MKVKRMLAIVLATSMMTVPQVFASTEPQEFKVPIEGTIQATEIKVTVPLALAYTIDPNGELSSLGDYNSYSITNDGVAETGVYVSSVDAGGMQLVPYGSEDWINLGPEDSGPGKKMAIQLVSSTGTHDLTANGEVLISSLKSVVGGGTGTETIQYRAIRGMALASREVTTHDIMYTFKLV